MPNKLIIFIILIFTFISSAESYAQVALRAPSDTSLQRGLEHEIPLFADLGGISGGRIELRIEFNALLLKIIGVKAGEGFLISSPNPTFRVDTGNYTDAKLRLLPVDFSGSSGKLLSLIVEPLAGPDSIARLINPEVKIDGADVSATLTGGTFNIGPPIFISPVNSEYLGLNFPNPFHGFTKFNFFTKKGKIKFYVYDIYGNLLDIYPERGDKYFKYDFFNQNNSQVELDLNNDIPQGEYTLRLSPVNWRLASGMYRISLETGSGVYTRSFILLK